MQRKWLLATIFVIVVLGSILIIYKRHAPSEIILTAQVFNQKETQPETPSETIYVIKEGDSLWSISQRFGVSIGEIAKLNNISVNKTLQIGDKLRIPAKSSVSPQEQMVGEKASQMQAGLIYQVKEGDSLWTIAKKFGVKVEDIARANNINLNKTLQIGDKLQIPQKGNWQITKTQPPIKALPPQRGLIYQVKKGDSLWTIARRYGVSAERIAGANNISLNKTLQIGEKLVIPGKVASSTSKSTLKVLREGVLVRKGPGANYSPLAKLSKGTQVISLGQQGDWQKVAISGGKVGWIRRDMLGLSLARKTATPSKKYASSKEGKGSSTVVRTALSYQGARYSYGGLSSRGFDCSGFVKYVYEKHGINLPHNASAQFKYGKPVSKSELQPGDLVFFRTGRSRGINHVGIYIGNGKFVHASSARGRVKIDSLNEGYYKARYAGARRLK